MPIRANDRLTGALGARVHVNALEAERSVHASAALVHGTLTDALGDAGFRLTVDQLTHLEARRGSALMGAIDKARLGVQAKVWVVPQEGDCRIQIRLQYQGIPLSAEAGAQRFLREILIDVGRAIDLALARLDPHAVFPPATLVGGGPAGAPGERIDLGVASQQQAAPLPQTGAPAAWTARDGVLFTLEDRLAWLDPAAAQAHLAIARLVLDAEGALPGALKAELEPFAVRLEQSIGANPDGLAVVPIAVEERPVLAFLHQQVRTRSALPVRLLHRCRDCHLEKITNPEYQRTQQQNRALRSLGGALGATISRGGITPFLLVGTLFNMRRLEPDYVCPRCQGMSAEESLVTYCKDCGELRKEAVLRTCPKCQFDFRTLLRREQFWVKAPPPAPPPVPVADGPTASGPAIGPHGGKVCRTCGQEFATLWRVMVVSPAGAREPWYVCATSPQCTPESVTEPVLV